MGRKYHDVYVQKLVESPEHKYKIVDSDGAAQIELQHNGKLIRLSPEQISAEILKYLHNAANTCLEQKVSKVVISIPAYFNNAQRKATEKAAKIANLEVVRLVSEPVAAAIHYVKEKFSEIPENNSKLLVFDLGGGTLDVSVIAVVGEQFEVKSIEGDTFLGGRDFDRKLMDICKSQILKKYELPSEEKIYGKYLRRIKKHCLNLKHKLSTEERCSAEPIEIKDNNGNDEDYALELTRADFILHTTELFNRSFKLVKKCIKEAGFSATDLNDVLLVGGGSRIPKIKEQLHKDFKNARIHVDINPDEAIALGAATQAFALGNDCSKKYEKYKVTDVTPLTIGLSLFGNLMKVAIKKNTPIPANSEAIKIRTVSNQQRSGKISIYEGERKNCEYNNLLGGFEIKLPPGKAGEIEVEVVFKLNEDGILEVKANETKTGKNSMLVVSLDEYRLCENKVRNYEEDASINHENDKMFETFTRQKCYLLRTCDQIIFDLLKIPDIDIREVIQKKCKNVKNDIKNLTLLEADILKNTYDKFINDIFPFIENYIEIDSSENDNVHEIDSNYLPQPQCSKSSTITEQNYRSIQKRNLKKKKR